MRVGLGGAGVQDLSGLGGGLVFSGWELVGRGWVVQG